MQINVTKSREIQDLHNFYARITMFTTLEIYEIILKNWLPWLLPQKLNSINA